MRTGFFGAMSIQSQCMIGNGKAAFLRNMVLALLNFLIVKLFNPPAIEAHQMIMMRACIEFKHGLTGFEMITMQ